jgi:glucose-1-phosphate cytidylyltransferase
VKVVLFCGGLGTRLREHSETVPKPLVPVGQHPVIWHLMKYYAHHGHKDFILCLGYRGDLIRRYFLDYQECMANDFTLSEGGKRIELKSRHLDDWRITFVDTGMLSNLGERLLRIRQYLEQEPMFLANYADGLSDLPLDRQIAEFQNRDAVASFVAVRTPQSFHAVRSLDDGTVTSFGRLGDSDFWINGGYFCLRPAIFKYIESGEELVEAPFQRLVERRLLAVYKHNGFWQAMDTLKDKLALDALEERESAPWAMWRGS